MGRCALAAAVAHLLVACARDHGGAAGPVRVGYAVGTSTATLWIAYQQGYFADLGVAIDWRQQNRPSTALPQLAVGNLDVLAVNVTIPLFNLIGRGERVRIVADRGHHPEAGCPVSAFIVHADRDPDNLPAQLKFSAAPGYLSEYLIERLMQSLGPAAAAWQLVEVPADAEVHALVNGGVDVVSLTEPRLSRALDERMVRIWRDFGDVYPNAQHYVLVFGPRLLDEQRELGASFLTAYLRAERVMSRGKTEENVAQMAQALDIDRDLARRICWIPVSEDLRPNHGSLADFQSWASDKALLDRHVSIEEYWDGWFAERAVAALAAPKPALR